MKNPSSSEPRPSGSGCGPRLRRLGRPMSYGSAALALALLATACGGTAPVESTTAVSDAAPIELRIEILQPTTRKSETALIGSVAAQKRITVSARILSNITAVPVAEGQFVKAGQSVIELDQREMQAALTAAQAARAEADSAIAAAKQAVAAAQAQLDLAAVTHGRYEELLGKKSVSQQEYDQAAARLRGAEAAVQMARSQKAQAEAKRAQAEAGIAQAETRLQYARITAPVSGYVVKRLVDPGAMAAPGTPLLEIEQAGGYRLEVGVPESQLGSLSTGQTLPIEIDALGEDGPTGARIVEIIPAVDPGSRTFVAKLALPAHPGLRSGLYGRAFLPGAEQTILTVPLSAVVSRGQLRSVFVVEGDRIVRRLVTLGAAADDRVEVLSGLEAGDRVALDPGKAVDGARAAPREVAP